MSQKSPAYSRVYYFYEKEKEIMKVKRKRNVIFPESRKTVEGCMNVQLYAIVVRESHFKNTSQLEKFETIIEKIIQLGPEDRPEFLEIKVKYINTTEQIKNSESQIPHKNVLYSTV